MLIEAHVENLRLERRHRRQRPLWLRDLFQGRRPRAGREGSGGSDGAFVMPYSLSTAFKLVWKKLMETIGAFEAKTHLAALLDRVANGEKITIARHGVPAAVLMPVVEAEAQLSHKEIVVGFRALRKRVKPGVSVGEMVNERRRF